MDVAERVGRLEAVVFGVGMEARVVVLESQVASLQVGAPRGLDALRVVADGLERLVEAGEDVSAGVLDDLATVARGGLRS